MQNRQEKKMKKIANLKVAFNPASVAVIGASDNPGKLGFHVMKSLTMGGFGGRIIPINPTTREIMGLKTFAAISDCHEPIELAIVVLPAKLVPGVFRQCADNGIKGLTIAGKFISVRNQRDTLV